MPKRPLKVNVQSKISLSKTGCRHSTMQYNPLSR